MIKFLFTSYSIIILFFVIYFFLKEFIRLNFINLEKNKGLISIFFILGLPIFFYEFFGSFEDNNLIYLSIVPIILPFLSLNLDKKPFLLIFTILVLEKFIKFIYQYKFFFILILFPYLIEFLAIILLVYQKRKTNFLNSQISKIFFIFFIWFFSYISTFFIFYFSTDQTFSINLTNVFIFYFSAFFVFYLINLILEKFYKNFFDLERFILKDEISFFKASLYKNEIKNFVIKNNLEFGVLFLWEIKETNIQNKTKILSKIKKNLEIYYNNTIFFRNSKNTYGFFIPLAEQEIKFYKKIKNNSFSKEQNDKLEKILLVFLNLDFNIKVFASIYGFSSNNIEDLIEECVFLLEENKKYEFKNKITFYQHELHLKDILDKKLEVSEHVKNKIENSQINFIKSLAGEIYYYEVKTKKEFELNKITKNEEIFLMRYFSMKAVEEFYYKENSNKKLIINYPFEYLSSNNFDKKNFIKKISLFTEPKNIIINFEMFENIVNNFDFKKNVNFLEMKKFSFIKNKNNSKILDNYIPFEFKFTESILKFNKNNIFLNDKKIKEVEII